VLSKHRAARFSNLDHAAQYRRRGINAQRQ
jgi:hypothetical protein